MDAVLDIIMSLFSDFDVNAIIEMLSSFDFSAITDVIGGLF
ncbi:MAG TPA: hypothetical protein PKN28_00685 [Clostridiales bacterium]|nr:hypothetical protein [Clostridiales bacterium]